MRDAALPRYEPAPSHLRDGGGLLMGSVFTEPNDSAAYLFDPAELRTYEILIAPEWLAWLDADPRAEQYAPATLVFEGKQYGPVGVRYKGSVGGFRDCLSGGAKACTKLSMKVSFNWQLPEVPFFGLRKLQFHAMNRDPSMLKERLGYWIFRQFGMAAPRVVHARLLINGQLAGLFAVVEQIDGRFTRSRFVEGGEGNLYKEAWPLTSARRPVNADYLLQRLETNENENPVFDPMLDFGGALAASSLEGLADVIATFTDVDYAMRYVAVDRTLAHDDGPFHWYCGGSCFNHNFYYYQELAAARLWIIPWDLDSVFNLDNPITTLAFPWDDVTGGCQARVVPPGQAPIMPPACDKLTLGWAAMQERYLELVGELLSGPFSLPVVDARLSEWSEQIAPVVAEAAALHADALPIDPWQQRVAALRQAIVTLRLRALARIEQGPLPIYEPWNPPAAPPDLDAGSELDGGP